MNIDSLPLTAFALEASGAAAAAVHVAHTLTFAMQPSPVAGIAVRELQETAFSVLEDEGPAEALTITF